MVLRFKIVTLVILCMHTYCLSVAFFFFYSLTAIFSKAANSCLNSLLTTKNIQPKNSDSCSAIHVLLLVTCKKCKFILVLTTAGPLAQVLSQVNPLSII